MQTTEASKQSSSGTGSSRVQRIMLQGAQIAHLESLLGAAAQPITSAPAYSAITPVLDASLVSSQVSMPDCTTTTASVCCTNWAVVDSGNMKSALMIQLTFLGVVSWLHI